MPAWAISLLIQALPMLIQTVEGLVMAIAPHITANQTPHPAAVALNTALASLKDAHTAAGGGQTT